MSNKSTKNPIFVKKSEATKGSLWNKYANKRIIEQHGGFDIPEGDLHAIHKFESPLKSSKISPEEMTTALSDIEKEIKELKEHDNQLLTPPPPIRHTQTQPNEDDDLL